VGAIERHHRVLATSHGVGAMRQRHCGVLVASELGDETDLDVLRLLGRDEAVRRQWGVTGKGADTQVAVTTLRYPGDEDRREFARLADRSGIPALRS
jgi:hypothetical protein